jgi:hypothetical protein
MILTPGDGNIHVKVGTVIAQEYRIEEKVEGKTVTRSCCECENIAARLDI